MAKIYFDENGIKNYVNGGLEAAILALKSANNVASILNIPYEFNYNSYLKKLDDNISSDLNAINEINNKIKKHSKQYSSVNDELHNNISGIDNYAIVLRYSAIK